MQQKCRADLRIVGICFPGPKSLHLRIGMSLLHDRPTDGEGKHLQWRRKSATVLKNVLSTKAGLLNEHTNATVKKKRKVGPVKAIVVWRW